ncbi:MAG: nucleotidyltransferase domain-containing protein [Candidatus Omnitrophica bacterium]|nr:nucleotidyltransferase domain-containing protein [Candidatus Omnitrophota bacterium]
MKIEFYPERKLKKQILEIIGRYLDLNSYKVFFFGSRVKKDNSNRSDIDIGIEGPKKMPIQAKLEIEEELDNLPTLYKFDLVDFKEVPEKFKKEALKYAEYIR